MSGIFLVIPLFLIRYGLLAMVNKNALPKAAFFPPMQGIEKAMFWLYQAATVLLLLCLFFTVIKTETIWFSVGLAVYLFGVFFFALSTVHFAKPNENGFCQDGLYRVSRNPMYLAYFIYFLGCVFITQSAILFGLLCLFQFSAHWIILSEERWCADRFGESYILYRQKVRRYI